MKTFFKSTGVILAAFIVNALLSILTDFLLESIGVLPDPEKGLFETRAIVLVLSYRAIYTIFTGFLVSVMAPERSMLLILIPGTIGTAITLMATNSAEFSDKAPLWYGYTLALITIPCLWLGKKIRESWRTEK